MRAPLRDEAGLLRWGGGRLGRRPNRIFASQLSPDAGRFNQGLLRSLIVVFLCFAWGYVWGAAPSPAEGDSPSDSHLRFAAV